MKSGLYSDLVNGRLLIPHEEVAINGPIPDASYKVIKPEQVAFISYPYEWCFSQLKDAALLTLEVQKKSLLRGMSLKDCSAYNIQFKSGRPVFIDTLSFEEYRDGQPWVAYRQFCQHFLAPLALMSHTDIRLSQLLRIYLDGIPLDLASTLLPARTFFDFSSLTHIHLHAKAQQYYSHKTSPLKKGGVTRFAFVGLIDDLESAIRRLKWKAHATEWCDYYHDTNYSPEAFVHKKQIVSDFLEEVKPRGVWDLGSNTGIFSRLAMSKNIPVISFDFDPGAVEKNYLTGIQENARRCLPLLLDLSNPSPGIGWENRERLSLIGRGPTDTVFALALIHHLAISHNLPFACIADFFHKICDWLIIEFVPKDDSQVQRMLVSRKDVFLNYTREQFERTFGDLFTIKKIVEVKNSERSLYLMRKKVSRRPERVSP
jgi:ribosomal protein L11 methylase PrmA